MPFKHIKYKIPESLDRRRKLTQDDREYIRRLYEIEKLGIREIARVFEKVCSRRLIQFVIFPERLKQLQAKHIAEKHHLKYYNKDKNKNYMKTHRRNKQKLYLENKLKVNTKNFNS